MNIQNVELELQAIQNQMIVDERDMECAIDLFFSPLMELDNLEKYSGDMPEGLMDNLECLEYLLSL